MLSTLYPFHPTAGTQEVSSVFNLLSAPFSQAPPPDDVNSHIGWGGMEGRIEGKG